MCKRARFSFKVGEYHSSSVASSELGVHMHRSVTYEIQTQKWMCKPTLSLKHSKLNH